MKITHAFAAENAKSTLAPFEFMPRALRAKDVLIDILYCGVCHSDIHQVRNEWHNTIYPVVPGHEIVGRVVATGANSDKYRTGDLVGVGCMVDSCRRCESCQQGLEQYCENGFTATYNGTDRFNGSNTYGGYSTQIVVNQDFVLRVPENLRPAGVAPLLCAGITTWSPLRHWRAGPGHKVGVVGLGGLGHMAVKLAHAMGAEVVLFTTSKSKKDDGKRLGADEVVISTEPKQMKKYLNHFDLILDTVAATHDLNQYLTLLKRDGTMTLVGAPEHSHPAPAIFNLIFKRRSIAGTLIGGIAETQEMLNFCGEHDITSDYRVDRY